MGRYDNGSVKLRKHDIITGQNMFMVKVIPSFIYC